MILRGASSLSDAELIAILLRTGAKGKSVVQVAQDLIINYGNLAGLATQSVEALCSNLSIGKDKAATLVAAFELTRRIQSQSKWVKDKKITSPSDVAEIFLPLLRDETKENFIVVCLSSSNKIIKYQTVTVGLLDSSLIHAREVFKIAIENNSKNIILLHNHPSGNPDPSKEDIIVTKKLMEAGSILEIAVFDHIILAGDLYTSLVEKRLV